MPLPKAGHAAEAQCQVAFAALEDGAPMPLTRSLGVVLVSAAFGTPSAFPNSNRPLFVVMIDDKRGFIDATGDVIIEPQFGGASSFVDGLANVAFYEPTYQEGYIDESGRLVIAPDFDRARDFAEGLAAVGFGEFTPHGGGDHVWGFIDRSGQMVIEAKYRSVQSFQEGLAAVLGDNGQWGYIDRTGKVAIPFRYDSVNGFSNGLACVERERLYGFINRDGATVISIQFTSGGQFQEGLASVRIGGKKVGFSYDPTEIGGQWVYIDKNGAIVIPLGPDVIDADNFSEGLAAIDIYHEGRSAHGFIDKHGTIVIAPRFATVQPFSEGLASVTLEVNEQPYFINGLGEVVLSPEFSRVGSFREGLAQIELGNWPDKISYGYINRTGKVVWAPSR
jgi:hypothetical protein